MPFNTLMYKYSFRIYYEPELIRMKYLEFESDDNNRWLFTLITGLKIIRQQEQSIR